ncbi:MAG TPA: hypothetical protein PLX08_11615 [Bacteroidales bacterium]|jgi:hypothetical protein|nr:hypothetical protein [Bacteroidales bacterium]
MNDNYRQLNDVPKTVTEDDLLKYFGMLPDASRGKLSKPYNRMFDAGVTVYSGFLYFSSIRKYKQVMIKHWGDWQIDNYSPEAEEVFKRFFRN